MNYKLEITLASALSPGSGEGWAGMIDADIVFDELGLPYIPGRRIKGILRDSARDVIYALKLAKVPANDSFSLFEEQSDDKDDLDLLFGQRGQERATPLKIGNAYLANYSAIREWLLWAEHKAPQIISPERVRRTFTSLRQQTAIDPETSVAKEHSLRITRVLNRGITFICEVELNLENGDKFERLLTLAVQVTRNLGGKRNRGLGQIKCSLTGTGNLNDRVLGHYRKILMERGNHD